MARGAVGRRRLRARRASHIIVVVVVVAADVAPARDDPGVTRRPGRVLRLGRANRVVDRVPRRPSAPALPGRPRHVLARRRFTHAQPPGARRRFHPRSAPRVGRVPPPAADGGRGRRAAARDAVASNGNANRGTPRMDPRGPHLAARGRDRGQAFAPFVNRRGLGHRGASNRLRVAAPDGEGSGRGGVGEVDGRKVRIDVEVRDGPPEGGAATATEVAREVFADPPCSSCSRRTDAGGVSTRGTTCRREGRCGVFLFFFNFVLNRNAGSRLPAASRSGRCPR